MWYQLNNHFKDKSVKLYNYTDNKIPAKKSPILYSTQNTPQQPLWSTNLPQTSPTLHQSNPPIINPTIVDSVSIFHGFMLSPTLPYCCIVIDAYLLTTLTELTADQVHKYPPNTQSATKVNIGAQHS